MTDITPNHLHIYRDRRGKHITLDGHDLLLDRDDPMLITGMENQDEVTRVMLTLLTPRITVDSEIEDQEPPVGGRIIPGPDELDKLAEGTIVRDKDGDAWRRTFDEWTTTADYGRFTSWAVSRSGPVTVLWEPEGAS